MANINLSFSVRHNALEEAQKVDSLPDKLTGAMREATPEAARATERIIARLIESIAGGVYWDINTDIRPTPDGSEARIITPPSKPHRIEPTKEHGLLVFSVGGKDVFVRGGVDHPGSNPVDWIRGMDSAPLEEIERPYVTSVTRALNSGGL